MWQRKQTIYLVLVVMLMVVSLFIVKGSGGGENLTWDVYVQYALAGLLVIYATFTISTYSNRKKQMELCRVGELFCLAKIAVFAFQHFYIEQGAWALPFYPALDVVSLILFEMAYKGVKHDDDLVKSADRIR